MAFCTFALLFGLTTPIRAEDPTPANSTSLNDWIQDVQDDATQSGIQFLLDHLTLDPSSIEWGKTINTDNLQIATWKLNYSAANVGLVNNLLSDAKINTFAARTVVLELQSQLLHERTTLDFAKYLGSVMPLGGPEFHLNLVQGASDRVFNTQPELSQARLTLNQASSDQGDLEVELASAKSDLRQAQADMGSAQSGLFYYSEVAPRMNTAANFAARNWPLVDIGRNAVDLMTNPTYRSQAAEGSFKLTGVLLDSASYAGGEAFWAELLGPLGEFRKMLHNAELTYSAFEHQNEAQNLAFGGFGGELSRARLPEVLFAPPDFDNFSGSFHSDAGNRVSIAGSWTAMYGTSDRFNAESRYSFDEHQTASGHVFTGIGIVSRERVEQHDPFQHEPLLNWINVFNFNDPMTVTEWTRRNESYNDSFNGALVNQSIQQRTPAVSLATDDQLRLELTQSEIKKKKPDVFSPPPGPPEFRFNVLGEPSPSPSPSGGAVGHGGDENLPPPPSGLSSDPQFPQPAVKGVLMHSNVTTQPVDVDNFLGD